MDTPTIPTECLTGPQSITQRYFPCNCGCKGSDSWHVSKMSRTVRNVALLSVPVPVGANRYVVATGAYKHPSGEMKACSLYAYFHPTVHVGGFSPYKSGYFWVKDGAR